MRTAVIALGMGITFVVVAYVASAIGHAKGFTQGQGLLAEAQQGYLKQRFDLAYIQAAPVVAIWEGTNLFAFMERTDSENVSHTKEEAAERVMMNARVSALFGELHDQNKAQEYAMKASAWFRSIAQPKILSPDVVVEESLKHDHLRRQWK
jgi:hypothetical protein